MLDGPRYEVPRTRGWNHLPSSSVAFSWASLLYSLYEGKTLRWTSRIAARATENATGAGKGRGQLVEEYEPRGPAAGTSGARPLTRIAGASGIWRGTSTSHCCGRPRSRTDPAARWRGREHLLAADRRRGRRRRPKPGMTSPRTRGHRR